MAHENIDPTELEEADNHIESQQFTITVYEIGLEDILIYIDQMEIDSHQEGWVAFNVSLPLKNWLQRPEENFGLQLVCRSSTTGFSDIM